MEIVIETAGADDFGRLAGFEWLETNGLGGWASSTVSGAHTRRYHGLLVAATEPPVGRRVLVSKLEETVRRQDSTWELGCNRYPGVVHPQGYRLLSRFRRGVFPVFEYEMDGIHLSKTVACVAGENTTLVFYELLSAPGAVELELRPLLTSRDYHALGPGAILSEEVEAEDGTMVWRPTAADPAVFLHVPDAEFSYRPDWLRSFELEAERGRGLDFSEDLWSPGIFRCRLEPGARLGVMLATEDPRSEDAWTLFVAEQGRRLELLARLPLADDDINRLGLAADQFIVRRGIEGKSVIAGYHWFADWGRDTMVALPGLCLTTGRYDEAGMILEAFADAVDQGMLPNRFLASDAAPEYNTVDATLWFFVAIWRYLRATGDEELVREKLLPVLRDIVSWHDRGTRFGIGVDDDGLLRAGVAGVQLTWMDAKIGDWVVTPRHGKPVEVNALWYNALRILAELEERLGDEEAGRELTDRARGVRRAFTRTFWNEDVGCLSDVVDGERRDASVRPNQILALGLPFPMLSRDRALRVLDVVGRKLLTPVGLRSLAPEHPDYRPTYGGEPRQRDSAYHQGTVWSWLVGPYVTALLRYGEEAGVEQARSALDGVLRHLADACVGSISEIFDAEPPHAPRGAVAQAWSVAEVLRARVEVELTATSGSEEDDD